MESLTNVSEKLQEDKKINLKQTKISSILSNSNNYIDSHSSNDDLSSNLISPKPNQISSCVLYGIPIVSLFIENQERLCLAQISNTLLKQFSYNEIHNRRVALGITCVQCTPVQLEILRRAGAMPVSSRRCGMITRREAERLCKSFLGDNSPPRLPDDFSFAVYHECAWGCRGAFLPSRYNSSRAKCIKCTYCGLFFSPNKFIFHSHRLSPNDKYVQPDAANFNSWRRHLRLSGSPPENISHAWEDVKAMFNGGTRKRLMSSPVRNSISSNIKVDTSPPPPPKKSTKDSHSQNSSNFLTKNIQHHGTHEIRGEVSSLNQSNSSAATVNPLSDLSLPLRSATFNQQDIPFSLSRSFMIDYVWHQQQQQQHSQPQAVVPPNKANFQFPPYSAITWIAKQQQPSSSAFLFKSSNNNSLNLSSRNDKLMNFNHFHSTAFKPVINMRFNNDDDINPPNSSSLTAAAGLHGYNHSPSSSTSSNNNNVNNNHMTNKSDDERLSPKKGFLRNEQHYDDSRIYGSQNSDAYDDDENEVVDIETTEDDDIDLNNGEVGVIEEEIKVSDDLIEPKENNNSIKKYFGRNKSPNKEILIRRDADDLSPQPLGVNDNKEQALNLKNESNRFNVPSTSYIHKINSASSQTCTTTTTDGPSLTTPTKLWSIARLSVECTNNTRTSLYHQFKGFHNSSSDLSHSNI
ncbi:hypothetical protein PVAND_011424 [Polypedilum vanderplanki]|uniref:c-SKI SMAD4-binding domain-containing protein n=1 Tax=Polypedilum vanderplanki TaxID=319348 RepID=A0A9J6CJF6_POLVA|nr:hypothetical protein PVAND_011424 [Polypedilum vanderplanki]